MVTDAHLLSCNGLVPHQHLSRMISWKQKSRGWRVRFLRKFRLWFWGLRYFASKSFLARLFSHREVGSNALDKRSRTLEIKTLTPTIWVDISLMPFGPQGLHATRYGGNQSQRCIWAFILSNPGISRTLLFMRGENLVPMFITTGKTHLSDVPCSSRCCWRKL